MKIGVFGNSRLGLPSLQMLLQNGLQLCLVLPDRPSDETDHLEHLAHAFGVTPTRISPHNSGQEIKEWFEREKPDLVVVLTFPYFIPGELLSQETPWFNFHYAPLPQYRGAEPNFWQLKNRETSGAVTVHLISEKPDAGPIVFVDPVPIDPDDTHGMHVSKLAIAGISSLVKLIQMWQRNEGKIETTSQDEDGAQTYPRVSLEHLLIRWEEMSALEIKALVQACNPWNKGAVAFLEGKPLRISSVRIQKSETKNERIPGRLVVDENGNLKAETREEMDLLLEVVCLEEGIYTGRQLAVIYDLNQKILTANHT
ncbi:MAG TPA: hypothetical protein DCG19_11045 [Cryomorphaceae bacterium]|nr:hypothetical protein [Owenweeksia sp.]HAD97933.1 hypothetical protein [Cryomorphaceae bacterium]HCQ16455.1 hypothetical protein [Cryomorphaceae bacterium]|tara:strand:- start:306 stop:1241 length:936 start_codon:yes stop_codon:yes gene_type:complete